MYFIKSHRYFALGAAGFNLLLIGLLAEKMCMHFNSLVKDAMGGRNAGRSLYRKCTLYVRQSIEMYDRVKKKSGLYHKAKEKMLKSGYQSQYAPAVYLLLRFALCPALFITSLALYFPSFTEAAVTTLSALTVTEIILANRKRSLELKLQKYIYKIYKYLHNQISSGVRVADAIRSVYEVIDEPYLKGILIQLAAMYELTLDIDASLDRFKSCYAVHEAETLCIALKQGIVTGDNQDILARQEEVMFKKYFNYIQAETDSCKMRCVMVALIYSVIIVLMISIPLLNDVAEAVNTIFVN